MAELVGVAVEGYTGLSGGMVEPKAAWGSFRFGRQDV